MSWVYFIGIVLVIIILFQSFTVVLFIKNAIVHAVLLLYLLLQELWKAIQYLYTLLTRSATIRHRYGMMIQCFQGALRRAWEAIWSIWRFEDRLRARVLPAANPAPNPPDNDAPIPEPTRETTHAPQSSGPTRCAGYTDKGRCERKRHVDGEVYYCHQHERQDPQARTASGVNMAG
ncbi:hypothetical protein BDR22DRAFT_514171 [Usnea florida]